MNPEREYTRAVDYFQALLRTIGGSDDPDKAALILSIMAARKELDRTYTAIFNRQAAKSIRPGLN